MDVEGERVELEPDALVRVGPAARRKIYAGPEGIRVLAIGGAPGEPYKIAAGTELSGATG
jgi:hypothetical protein